MASHVPTAAPTTEQGPSGLRSRAASVASEPGSACSCGTAGSAAHGHGGHGQGQKVLFRWTQEGAYAVSVVGSWNGWGKPLPLEGTTDAFGRGHLFSRIVDLPPGRHHFKFIVDGQWKYDSQCEFETDAFQVINNVVEVPPRAEHSSHQMLIEPHKRGGNGGAAWTSMPGDQARHKWERASEAMQQLAVTRSDSQEGVIMSLTAHERQQVANSLREFGLDLSSSTASAVAAAAAAATVAGGPVIRPEEKEGGGGVQKVGLPAEGPLPGGNRSSMASLGSSHLAAPAYVDDDIHPPPVLKTLISQRGSQLASLLGGGSGLPPGRSRSLTDLDRMQAEYSQSPLLATLRDTGSGLYSYSYALPDQGPPPGTLLAGKDMRREGAAVRAIRQQEAACAAVGSCAVKSTVRRDGKLILAMVGLPGRGKTHIARALRRHLEWMGLRVGYFNSSEYRRRTLGSKISPDFFDPTDAEAWQVRREIAAKVLQEMMDALRSDIDIAVFDAANCTRARRRWIRQQVQEAGLYAQTIFIESQCESAELIASNIHQTILRSPEYRDMSEQEATADFERKNAHYMAIYETVQEAEDFSFLKLVDGNRKLTAHRINGYIPGRIMLLLANIHTKPRPIWFSRHGESQFNAQGRIGGDSPLSPRGMLYAEKLNEFVSSIYPPSDPSKPAAPDQLSIWTSTLVRTGMTVAELNKSWEVIKWRCLDEIDAGICDGLTYQQVLEQFPDEYKKRKEDKYMYRYPRGESYQDVFLRLEPVIFEMLRTTTPLLIVGHQAILRIIYGYLMGKRPEDCPELPMPLHTVIQLTPLPYGCEEVWHSPMSGVPGEKPEHPGANSHHVQVHPRNQGGDI